MMESLRSLDDIRKDDKMVDLIYKTLSSMMIRPLDDADPSSLLRIGSSVLGACGYLRTQAVYHESRAKLARLSYEQIWDATFTMARIGDTNVTDARSEANQLTRDAELEVLKAEHLAKAYKACADTGNDLLIFLEVGMKHLREERLNINNQNKH